MPSVSALRQRCASRPHDTLRQPHDTLPFSEAWEKGESRKDPSPRLGRGVAEGQGKGHLLSRLLFEVTDGRFEHFVAAGSETGAGGFGFDVGKDADAL